MGKILVIKEAGFSQVAVKTVTISDVILSKKLTPVILNGLSIGTNGAVGPVSGWALYYVPIIVGKTYHLQIEWSSKHYQRVGTSSATPVSGSSLTMLVNQVNTAESVATLDYTYKAELNGYLAWQMHVEDTISCSIIES